MQVNLGALTRKRPLSKRPLFSAAEAGDLAELFRVLANDSRLRLLHALEREGELSVGTLAKALHMTSQAVSNQLRRLADKGIVAARREQSRIFYRVIDPCVNGLLELGTCLAEESSRAGFARPKQPLPPLRRGRTAP